MSGTRNITNSLKARFNSWRLSVMRHLEASRADTPRTDEFNSWGLGSSAARGGE